MIEWLEISLPYNLSLVTSGWCNSRYGYLETRVLMNLDGFIALLAIISGVAVLLNTVLRMWESEQQIEIDNLGVELEHGLVIVNNMNTSCTWKKKHKSTHMKWIN